MTQFDTLGLSPITLNALTAMGFTTATPVQGLAIPTLMKGRDIVAQARTGTGKTAAFGIPIAEHAQGEERPGVHFLVLVPTRELALQVSEELTKIARGSRLDVIPIYGGVGFGRQTDALSRRTKQVIVATPGRLLDLMNQRFVNLTNVQFLVLDEADRMLDMGFLPDVERILKVMPRDRMTALFSATLPDAIRRLMSRFLNDPETIKLESGPTVTALAEQFQISIGRQDKPRGLLALLTKETPERAIVFTRTKHQARRLAHQLEGKGHAAVALQGNMSQSQRERALGMFRDGKATILVATDVASRGLDIPEVSHIVNFDLPTEAESYVHRVGRTARMGRSGRAFTFVQPDQRRDMADVERAAGMKVAPYDLGELPPAPPPAPYEPEGGGRQHGGRNQGRQHGGRGQQRGGQRNGGGNGNRNQGPKNGTFGGDRRNFRQGRPQRDNRVPPSKEADQVWSEAAPTYDPY